MWVCGGGVSLTSIRSAGESGRGSLVYPQAISRSSCSLVTSACGAEQPLLRNYLRAAEYESFLELMAEFADLDEEDLA